MYNKGHGKASFMRASLISYMNITDCRATSFYSMLRISKEENVVLLAVRKALNLLKHGVFLLFSCKVDEHLRKETNNNNYIHTPNELAVAVNQQSRINSFAQKDGQNSHY